MNKKTKITLSILAILFGVLLFVFGGYDDSPGAQLIGLIAAIFGIVVIIKMKKIHNVVIIVLFLYTLILLGMIVFKYRHGAIFEFSQANFVPFKTIAEYLSGYPTLGTARRNLLGNIVLFVPVGLLLPLVFQKKSKMLWLGLLTYGIMPEILQAIFRSGIFDIDDIILNSLGVIAGYFLFNVFRLYKIKT